MSRAEPMDMKRRLKGYRYDAWHESHLTSRQRRRAWHKLHRSYRFQSDNDQQVKAANDLRRGRKGRPTPRRADAIAVRLARRRAAEARRG